LIALTVLALSNGFGIALLVAGRGSSTSSSSDAPSETDGAVSPAAPESADLAEGPWGRLEVVPIVISPPLEFIPTASIKLDSEPTWYFPDLTWKEVRAVFEQAGMPEAQQRELAGRCEVGPSGKHVIVRPTREFVMALQPDVRSGVYHVLHDYAQNKDQVNGFRFRGDSPEQWFADSPMSAEVRDLVVPRIYRQGSFMFFSDLRSVEPLLPGDDERLWLIQTLSRERTLLVRLVLTADSDLDALVRYWGLGGRAKKVRPILESMIRLGGEQTIDVAQLLPPFVGQRLYTYPEPPVYQNGIAHDCHWTALNFFSDEPDDQYATNEGYHAALRDEYHQIYGNPQLGDLVLYVREGEGVIHSAVYIAAGILFTKNGTLSSRPWMFLHEDDMKCFYPRGHDVKSMYLRRKGL